MTVSGSITQTNAPVVSSSRIFDSLVSLCVTRSGSSPAARSSTMREPRSCRAVGKAISSAALAARARPDHAKAYPRTPRSAFFGIVKIRGSIHCRQDASKSDSWCWKFPNAQPTMRKVSGLSIVSRQTVCSTKS